MDKVAKLHKTAYELWRRVCLNRDGHTCQVQRYFPNIQMGHCECIQVDHCISRANKVLFYEPRNGTVVCASCNGAKSRDQKSVRRAIDEIVKKREGEGYFQWMVDIDSKKCINPNFNKIWWLEQVISDLSAKIKEQESHLNI